MKGNFFKRNLNFLIPVLIFISAGIVFLSLFTKEEIHIAQNSWYSVFWDSAFPLITHLGDGFIFLGSAIILIFIKWRFLIGMVYVALLTGLLVGFTKNVMFKGEPRPVKFFEDKQELRLVEGVDMNEWNSFPSGHTTAAFAFWGFLAFIVKRKDVKSIFFTIAILAGYSRIYLSQHFLQDVVAGMFLGTSIAITSYYLMHRIKGGWAEKALFK